MLNRINCLNYIPKHNSCRLPFTVEIILVFILHPYLPHVTLNRSISCKKGASIMIQYLPILL